MSNTTILSMMDFSGFEMLLHSMAGDDAIFAVVADGATVWTPVSSELQATWLINEASCLEKVQKLTKEKPILSEHPQYYQAIFNDFDEAICTVILLLSHNSSTDENQINQLLESICSLIRNEFSLNQELEQMAEELSERYEELNLVYDTEHSIDLKKSLHDALQGMVVNCTDYLNVAYVELALPNKKMTFSHLGTIHQHGKVDAKSVVSRSTQKLWQFHLDKQSSIVLNSGADAQGEYLLGGCKLMSVPVMLQNGVIDGYMVVCKSDAESDFSNSDRNLLEVMVKKVTSIIQSNYDSLTGLINRKGYEQQLHQLLENSRKNGESHCVINLDIDDFHIVNDTVGHAIGDTLLKSAADLVSGLLIEDDFIARIGANEFGILISGCSLEFGEEIANKLRMAVEQHHFKCKREQYDFTCSVGVTLITPDIESPAVVESNAQLAVEKAKTRGKNRVESFWHTDEELARLRDEMNWVKGIKVALKLKNFVMFAQTIQHIDDPSSECHFETLIRLQDEYGNYVPPFQFLPAAEKYHLMYDVDRYVIKETFALLGSHRECFENKNFKASINLSGQSICIEGFLNFIKQQLRDFNIPPKIICFEITESAAMANFNDAITFINQLKALGIKISLDDFGTGLSSFEYLKKLPVDYLKIDGAFVKDLIEDKVSDAMVSAVHKVGHVMGLKTIAEFVENDAICARLKQIGVNYAQGYGIAKPIPLEDFLNNLKSPPPTELP